MNYWVILVVVTLYIGWMLYIGLRTRKWVTDSSDYLIAGREIGMLALMMGLFSIIAAGTTFSGATGLGYSTGMGGAIWGLSWAFAAIVSAIFFVPLVRACGGYTLAEWLGMRYGMKTQVTIAIPQIVGSIFSGAAQIVGSAFILSGLTGWSYLTAVLVSGIIVLVYTYLGGLWAVAYTEIVQAVFCVAAVVITVAVLNANYGGFDFLKANLPETYFKYPGTLGWGVFDGNWKLLTAIGCVWGYIMIVIPNTYIWTKTVSARSSKVARYGFLGAALICILFLTWPIAMIGMYGKAIGLELENPQMVFGTLIKGFPSIVAAIVLVGILSAIMSTASGAAIGAGSSALRDLYSPFKPKATSKDLIKPTRVITALCWLLIIVLAITMEKIGTLQMLGLAFAYYSVTFPVYVASFYFPKVNQKSAFYSTLISLIVTTIYVFSMKWNQPPLFIHPIWVGSGVTTILMIVIQMFTKEDAKKEVKFNQEDYNSILREIALGRTQMVYIMDHIHIEGKYVMMLVDKLIEDGFVRRKGDRGNNYQELQVTEPGIKYLGEFDSYEKNLVEKYGISKKDLNLLKGIAEIQNITKGIIRYDDADNMKKLSTISNTPLSEIKNTILFLNSKGLLSLTGLLRMRFGLSKQGSTIIEDNI
ncbi:MAG: sodium:solute symporter family protein [Gudongella sp.]|nr:sodium:solute symporter family protein [Gudongella sp.]